MNKGDLINEVSKAVSGRKPSQFSEMQVLIGWSESRNNISFSY